MAVYLINLPEMRVVGRFDTVLDAEVAGELMLGTAPFYIGDVQDLQSFTKAEILRLLEAVGKPVPEFKVKHITKAELLTTLEDIVSTMDFTPLPPPKPEKAVHKAAPRKGLMPTLYELFTSGQSVDRNDYPLVSNVTWSTVISDLRSAKYTGGGRRPLIIQRECTVYTGHFAE